MMLPSDLLANPDEGMVSWHTQKAAEEMSALQQ